jgi:hypothetical protein
MTAMTLKTAGAAAAVVLAAVCLGTAPAASADSEDYFLNELYKTGKKWYWPYGEGYIIGVGRGVCDDWNAGVAYPDEVESLAVAKGWTHRNTRFFIALATGAFCPERFESQIPLDARQQHSHWPPS